MIGFAIEEAEENKITSFDFGNVSSQVTYIDLASGKNAEVSCKMLSSSINTLFFFVQNTPSFSL